jgi:hypothetical protein
MSKALTVIPEKAHADLGASSASRWMQCPGSIRLSADIPNPSSSFAEEGTAAHALAELALSKKQDPDMWLGMSLEGVEVTEDMVEHVRTYVEACRAVEKTATKVWIEHRFNLGSLNPPAPMFGTGDFVAYRKKDQLVEVIDLKYGSGVVVEVVGNKQLRYYALGAVLSPELKGLPIKKVRMTVVQPRAAHPDGVVRSETITLEELLDFTEDLMAAARATLVEDATLKVGDHCRFCRAMAVCPAQKEHAEEVAATEFSVIPAERVVLPAPESLTLEQLTDLTGKFPIVEAWMKAVRGHMQGMLERGQEVPGFKLVQKRALRKWLDEEDAAQELQARMLGEDDIYVKELKSPAQIEKLLGKKNFPSHLVIAKSSGVTMVPEHDPRPAVAMGEEFTALTGANE